MTGKDMLEGIQNLDVDLIEEAEFGKFQKHQAGIPGKKKLLFLKKKPHLLKKKLNLKS